MQRLQKAMPKYYTYNNQKYSICFPLEWAINHFEQTGPDECEGCFEYGCDDSIFKQYCMDCQVYEYMGSRVTEEYCHAASRQPTHPAEVHNYFYTSDISDISDGEDTWTENHYLDADGNTEYKSSVNFAMNETLTDDDELYPEHYSSSGRVCATVAPILHKCPITVSFDSECMLHLCTFKTPTSGAVMSEQGDADCAFEMCNGVNLEENLGQLHCPPFRQLKKTK